jgi:uncharacterized protein YndB with AHSA1/START domain
MGFESLTVSAVVSATADRVYASWLDRAEHRRMTDGGSVRVEARVGSDYQAWDSYVTGRILELEPGRRIVQSWRTTDFLSSHPDSRLELHLRDVPDGCEVMILHTEIPEGLAQRYEEGWRTHYLLPMARYFAKSSPRPRAMPGGRRARGGASRTRAPLRAPSQSKRAVKR